MNRAPVVALLLLALLVAPGFPAHAQETSGGTPYRFPLTKFNDTLFAAVDNAYRAAFDDEGDVWYSTESGVVHILVDETTRELYTKMDGLPSSLALGLAIDGKYVYAGTDLGLAIIDRTTGKVTNKTVFNSPIPDDIVREVAVDGDKLWVGMHFGGVGIWNRTTDQWTFHNTSTRADWGKPVRRIHPMDDVVWVATDGDGAWRYDRATREWNVTLQEDGLLSNGVLAIAQRGGDTFFGTDRGLARRAADGTWTAWNATNGMPDESVLDLDVIETEDGGTDVFAATRNGIWQFDPETGGSATHAQEFGILGSYVFDESWVDGKGWLFATTRGVSLLNEAGWSYFSTGPTNGPSPGPLNYRFTAAATSPDSPFVWVGTDDGIAAFVPAAAGNDAVFYNLGAWQDYPGGPVNEIDVEGSTTWLATNFGAFGYDLDANAWLDRTVEGSRNLVYGIDAVDGELWVALFGDGLVVQNLTTGVQRAWNYQTLPEPLPDQYLTDVRVVGDTVWMGSSVGIIRMDRVTGTFKGVYTQADGVPGNGVVYRVLPDGPVVYIGTREGGVGRLDITTGRVNKVWNATTTPGFPDAEVRAFHREGDRLWVGTKGGLVRIDLESGLAKTYNQTHSGLVQEFVSGITSRDGLLYLATASGIARFEIATEAFLPMRDGPGVVRGTPSTTTPTVRSPVSVRIDSPRDGVGVTGVVEVRGSASHVGGRVDRVEVRIGEGPWADASGRESWSFLWDTAGSTPNVGVTISARAISGANTSREVEILVIPVALPTIPLELEHSVIHNATASRALVVAARATGDEPLSVALYYKIPGRDSYTRLDLARAGPIFSATIPAKHVQQGILDYYLEARSGLLLETSPVDSYREPHHVEVGPPPRLAVDIEGPALVDASAGVALPIVLNVTNLGSEAASYVVGAAGLRASWVTTPTDSFELAPGASREVRATLAVPAAAFADNTTITFEVRDIAGIAESRTAVVPVRILAAPPASTTPAPPDGGSKPAPMPAVLALVAAALAAGALGGRRWRK